MDRVRMGIIGLGVQGSYHVALFKQGKIERAEVTAVCDIVPEKLAPYGDYKTFTSSEAMIRSGDVDAVLIATPHYDHTTIGIDALQNGVHVLVEKPISVHVADAQKLIAAHTDPKVVFAAMFNQRTDPKYINTKQLIASGELGEIRRVQWTITDWFRPEAYYASGGWRATWQGEGGGVLLNQCPHNLDLLQWLCGMPNKMLAFCRLGKYHNIEVEDDVTAYFQYPNGATGVFITTTGEAPGTNRLEIAGDNGKVVLEGGKITFTRTEVPVIRVLAHQHRDVQPASRVTDRHPRAARQRPAARRHHAELRGCDPRRHAADRQGRGGDQLAGVGERDALFVVPGARGRSAVGCRRLRAAAPGAHRRLALSEGHGRRRLG